MNVRIKIFFICMLPQLGIAQTGNMSLQGAIQVGSSINDEDAGVVKWADGDFKVWNGVGWTSLTGNLRLGSMTDQDGNTYNTVLINGQEWMTENLRAKHYANGDPIQNYKASIDWDTTTIGAWCHYDNNPVYESTFGILYNWMAVDKGVCPSGWSAFVSWSRFVEQFGDIDKAGGRLKEEGKDSWTSPNVEASNETGFSGGGGGYRDQQGIFQELGEIGGWWSSRIPDPGLDPELLLLVNDGPQASPSTANKNTGLSVRCAR